MDIPQPTTSRRSGLSILLGNSASEKNITDADLKILDKENTLLSINLDDIYRNEAQPRTTFNPDAIFSLATSIESNGIIQPIAVRNRDQGGYEIIAGERRWLAAKQAGLKTIPAVLHDVDEKQTLVLALVENLVREDLSPLETARAYAALQDEFSMSISDLAKSVGKSRPAVSNTLRLLELPDSVLEMLDKALITEGHGRALLGLSDRLEIQRLAKLTVNKNLSVRVLEDIVRESQSKDKCSNKTSTRSKWNLDPDTELLERVERISEQFLAVKTKVKLGTKGGKLEFICNDSSALVDLIESLEKALNIPA